MTQTRGVLASSPSLEQIRQGSRVRARLLTSLLSLSLFGVFACDEKGPPEPTGALTDLVTSEAGDEPSPNARILPEPLTETEPRASAELVPQKEESPVQLQAPREAPRAWPLRDALPPDDLKKGVAATLSLDARFVYPDVARSVQVGEQLRETWPLFKIELLRERQARQARVRWVMENGIFPLPPRTELRARADRLGSVLLWPDQRSYRVVPPGALRSVFSDRRVDRLPRMEATEVKRGKTSRLGRDATSVQWESPLGQAKMDFVVMPKYAQASALLCSMLLELVRIEDAPELCEEGQLPVRLEGEWATGGRMLFEVTALVVTRERDVEGFRLPPPLPIFKNGELPPFAGTFLSSGELRKAFPLQEKSTEMTAPEPVVEGKPAPGEPEKPEPRPFVPRVKNELLLINHLDRPLIVLMNRLPLLWLDAQERKPVYVPLEGVRLSARDFFGEIQLDLGNVKPASDAHFGAKPAEAAVEAP